ncbi:response regulator [Chloroflexus sp.]|uniref:response regulator n=1 Tax=Chloroflexus sp. TaxID=1904827 RepID=UPI0026336DD8|nr:response regulator [uncultured Chloroflexus sp.]
MTYRIVVVARTNPVLRRLPEALAGDAQVQMFESANDALWSISTEPPDLVLSELDLDEMSGLDLAEIVPNFDPHTRVVLWGKGLSAADRERARAAGVATVLSGEISLDAVRAAVATALDTPRAEPVSLAAHSAPAHPVTDKPDPTSSSAAKPEPVTTESTRPAAATSPIQPPAGKAAESAPPAEDSAPRRSFTPARIVLPSRAEREAAERAAREAAEREAAEREAAERAAREAHARGGLAARTRAAADRRAAQTTTPSASPSPATPEPPLGWRSDGRNLIVTEQNIAAIRSVMSQLGQDLGTQSIMLTDRAGMILVETGDKGNLPLMVVLPLLSTGFSTTGEVARQLREEDATSVYIHEGANIDLYCFDVAQRFLLVLVFNKRVASSKIGAVWVNAKRAIRELRDVLAR